MGSPTKRESSKILERHTKPSHTHSPTNKNWSQKLIKGIIEATTIIWETQNLLKFGNSDTKLNKAKQRLAPKITYYYKEHQHLIGYRHYHIFSTPLPIQLKLSPQENKQWIRAVKVSMKIQKKEQRQYYKSNKIITQYLYTKKRNITNSTPQDSQNNKSHIEKNIKRDMGKLYLHYQKRPHQLMHLHKRKHSGKNLSSI